MFQFKYEAIYNIKYECVQFSLAAAYTSVFFIPIKKKDLSLFYSARGLVTTEEEQS